MDLPTSPRIVDLTTERLVQPLGVATARPLFGWRVETSETAGAPTGHELEVRNAEGHLLWGSGVVHSGDSTDVEYAGPELSSDRRYEWRVRAWTSAGATPWASAEFETSLLSAADWTAQWLVPEQEPTVVERYSIADVIAGFKGPAEPPIARLRPPQQVRQTFDLPDLPLRARLYASARGIYEATVNSSRAGDQVLAPGYDVYHRRLSFQCYDVTDLLVPGENVIGMTVADGWWAGRVGITGSSAPYGDTLAGIWQLTLEFADGRRDTVSSGGSEARSRRGGHDYADLFIGERYDRRAATPGWDAPGFDTRSWTPVAVSSEGREVLTPFAGEPVRRTHLLTPKSVVALDDQTVLVDVGQVIAGRLRLVLEAPAGTTFTVEHTEVLAKDGSFFDNIAGPNKDQTDVYVAGGHGQETYEPTFTFHGFRYARIRASQACQVHDVVAVVLGSDLQETSGLMTSDPRIDRLHQNVVWSQRANFLSIPTDCPQRERAGWTGDMQVFAPTAATNMDVRGFVERWLANVRAEQYADGGVPVVVPVIPSMIDGGSDREMIAAGWSDAIVQVPWVLYERYADTRVLADNFAAMRRWVDYQWAAASAARPERLANQALDEARRARHAAMWNTGRQFGDWLAPSSLVDGWDPVAVVEPNLHNELIAAMFHVRSTEQVGRVAHTLGRADDERELSKRAEQIREAFAAEYVSHEGLLPVDLQGPYVLALAFGLIPPDKRAASLARLTHLILANGRRLDTGFLSTPYLLDVLWDAGEKELARDLLWSETPPSWLYAVRQGATTVWESWEAVAPDGTPSMSSLNHYAFGCVDDWIFRRIVGIEPLAPGYSRVRIAPDLTGPLSSLQAHLDTVRGRIEVAWSRSPDRIDIDVSIPPGVIADVQWGSRHDVLTAGRHKRRLETADLPRA